jgi:hypothetical protein
MKVEDYQERKADVAGWEVNLTSYRLENEWHGKVDNVAPGATLCRTTGASREEVEAKLLQRAEEMLGRTRRHEV